MNAATTTPSDMTIADEEVIAKPERKPKMAHPRQLKKQPKTGRNDSCPCGSGEKYKKCCLIKRQEYFNGQADIEKQVEELMEKTAQTDINKQVEELIKQEEKGK